MDYTSGTDLVKHQWDAIHDPGLVVGMFEKDEEGMSIAAGYLAATEEKNGINMTSSITCLSGGGVPITLPDNLKSVEFYTDNPVLGEGTLVGFTTQNDEWYVGVYEAKSKKFLGYSKVINSTTKNILEKVEFQNGAPVLYPDKKTKEIKNDANAKVFLGFRTGCSIEVRTIPLSQFSSKIINDINYGGGDLTDIKTSYQAASIFHYNEFDDRLCPCIRKLNPLTFKDVFVGYEWARYNAYGEGGVLMKLTVKGEDEFYYTNQDATGNAYCYRYDFVGKNWVVEPMQQPTPGDYTAAIFSSGFALKFLKELAPTALDVLGSVPVYGIPFNLVNGVWYSIKNENTSAAISFASCIPIEGAILVGLKWTHQIIQTGENSYRLLKISEEANSIIKTLVTNAEQVSKSVLDDGIKEIISLAEKYPDFRQSIKSLAEQVKDREKFKNILNKINSIDDASLFLKDISITSDDAVHLANNLNKIDEGIIDAWLLLDGSTGIRKNIDNLENLSKVLKSGIYKNWGTIEELKAAINNSGSKSKFIENLSKANPASKYPIDGFRELAQYWSNPTKVKRFKNADEFYKKYKPHSSPMDLSKIDDELRCINFDDPVSIGTVKKDEYLYSWVYPKRGTADEFIPENVGQYFTKNPNFKPEILGIPRDNRILRKFKVEKDLDVFESIASDIQWRGKPDTEVYTGSGSQFYIPDANGMANLKLIE